MLAMKESCEACGRSLAHDQAAYICSYECTYCSRCVRGPVGRVCPSCQGELVRRPRRTDGEGPTLIDQLRENAVGEILIE